MSNINNGVLDGVRRIGAKVRDLTIDGQIAGAPLGFRLRGANTSGAPTTGTWKAGDETRDRHANIWICIAGGTPGTWVQAGSTDWVNVKAYGATGNTVYVTNGAITASSNVFSTASHSFAPADTGKPIVVYGAGSGDCLVTTISSVSAGSAVLAASATQTVTGTRAYWGTDDTAAIQAAITAAQVNRQIEGDNLPMLAATVFFPFGGYMITSPLHIAGQAGVRLTGNWGGSAIRSAGSAIIDFQSTYIEGLEIDHLTLEAAGGHVFTNPQLKYSWFHHLYLMQNSPGYSVWDQTQAAPNQLQEVDFSDIKSWAYGDPVTGLRSVSAWNIACPVTEDVANLRWDHCQFQNPANASGLRDTSQYIFSFACTRGSGAFGYSTTTTMRDCDGHDCHGGFAWFQSASAVLLDRIAIFDTYNLNGQQLSSDLIKFSTYSGGTPCRGAEIRSYTRDQGITPTLNSAGDIYISSDTTDVFIQGMTPTYFSTSTDMSINLNGADAVLIGCDPAVTINNPPPNLPVIGSGGIQAGNAATLAKLFGPGTDGAVTLDGSTGYSGFASLNTGTKTYTLTRDVYAASLTINSTVTLLPAVFRIFAAGPLINNGTIDNSGASASGATAGASVSTAGVLMGSRSGGAGTSGNGVQGSAAGTAYGAGNSGAGGAGTSGKTAGAARTSAPISFHRLPESALAGCGGWNGSAFQVSGAPGAGSGGGDGTNSGGGGGAGGGIIVIFAYTVTNNGTVSANGGNGGTPPSGNCGGGGSGGGGVILVYSLYTWTAGTTSVAAGTAGTASGTGSANGSAGTAGTVLNVLVA